MGWSEQGKVVVVDFDHDEILQIINKLHWFMSNLANLWPLNESLTERSRHELRKLISNVIDNVAQLGRPQLSSMPNRRSIKQSLRVRLLAVIKALLVNLIPVDERGKGLVIYLGANPSIYGFNSSVRNKLLRKKGMPHQTHHSRFDSILIVKPTTVRISFV